jgi:hypothetical protein
MPKVVVEGPDGRKFAFPDTMPRAQINEFMRTKYGTKARDESVQDYLARFGREQAATEARAKDIDREATAVGRAEGERAAERMGVSNPLEMAFAAPAIGLAQQEGGRRVFDREGTVLADEAAGLAAANSAGFFIPGLVNPQFGARVEEGRRQQPLAAFAGDIAGGYGPGEIIGAGVAKAAQAIGPGMAAVGRMFSRGPGPNATNAIAGGTLGGIAPAETAEERARNIAVGVGLGAVARPASQMVDDLTRTGAPRAIPDAMPAGAGDNPYFGRQSMQPQGFVGRASRDPAIQRRLDTAERMEKEGASREEIWTETMVMRGADGKLRAEIDDKPSRISDAVFDRIKESGQYDGRAAWALEHPELYKSYPELGEGRMVMTASETPRGSVERLIVNGEEVNNTTYVSGPGTNAQRSVALHELQHGVQNIEGFARGGTVGQFTDILTRLGAGPKDAEDGLILAVHLERQNGSFEEALGAFELTMGRTPTSKAQRLAKDYGRESLSTMTELGSMAAYRRLAGEVEARLVQTRRNMSMEDRRKRPAWEDEDVARDQQTVNFDNTRAEMAGAGGYFGRQSMRPPGSGPSAREIELRQQWSTATPIVTQARTTAQSAQQAADAALQSKAPADIARAKDQKKTLVSQIKEAQASRAGMDTPEDARLAETLASLTENTSDPVLLSTQISAAKTSLDRLLTDIGSPVEGNLIPVKTNILTRTQAPRSAAEGPQDRASVTRYAKGEN